MIKKEPDQLLIKDGIKRIFLSMSRRKCIGCHIGEDGRMVDDLDENQIEICFRQDDEHGWGAGGGEYVSTSDIKAMADCIRGVICMKLARAEYACQKDLFRIILEYDSDKGTYTFTAALINMLTWDYHITITMNDLTKNALDEYIQPFFEWEREFPIVE